MKRALFIIICLSLSLAVHAGRPKIGPGLFPGIGDGDGNETGGSSTTTEVTLPVGLPVMGDDPAASCEPSSSNIVYAFDISSDGNSSANQTHSALEKARDMNAAAVLIRINGFAGGWDVAENIRQELLTYDRPVMVYVNNQTIPAAQFISLGADSIYTKKGSTISNKKANSKSQPIVTANTSQPSSQNNMPSATTVSSDKDSYADDVTMNEILYKAGLGNLTVVHHTPGFAERAVDFMMNPFMMLIVLLVVGFVLKKTAHAKLPGPMMYVLAVVTLICFAPFQLAGLATPAEILMSVALIIAVIFSARRNKSLVTAGLLIGLTFTLTLVRTGDTGFLLQYTSFRELLALPTVSMSFLILGWCIGIIPLTRSAEKHEEQPGHLNTAAAA